MKKNAVMVVNGDQWTMPSIKVGEAFPTIPGLSERTLEKAVTLLREQAHALAEIMPDRPVEFYHLIENYWNLAPGHHRVALATNASGHMIHGVKGIRAGKARIASYLKDRKDEIMASL